MGETAKRSGISLVTTHPLSLLPSTRPAPGFAKASSAPRGGGVGPAAPGVGSASGSTSSPPHARAADATDSVDGVAAADKAAAAVIGPGETRGGAGEAQSGDRGEDEGLQ